MTFNIVSQGDQPIAPGNYAYQFLPDQLIAGQMQLVTKNVVLMSGTLPRGTVLGRQSTFSLIATPGTNTGNGTVGSMSMGSAVEYGKYVLTATSPTVFSVVDPEGQPVGNATVGTAFTSTELNFTIAAGGTAFVVGDSFAITSQESAGNFVACVKTASDGSQVPVCILVDYADASAGPVRTGGYFAGEFNIRAVSYDNSWNISDLAAALEARTIYLKSSVSAADPINQAANSTF